MKRRLIVCAVIALGLSGHADGATFYLENPTPDAGQGETSGSMTLFPGDSGTMNLMLDTSIIDTIKVAFINAFLDTTNTSCDVDVTAVTHGQGPPWIYDDSAYDFPPMELSDDCDGTGDPIKEYGLVFGDQTVDGGFPLGSATWLIESLTLTHTSNDNFGELGIFFEGGVRMPQLFGPANTYFQFGTNDTCQPQDVPNVVNFGVGNYGAGCADAFDITGIPEPAAFMLLAFGWMAVAGKARHPRSKVESRVDKKLRGTRAGFQPAGVCHRL